MKATLEAPDRPAEAQELLVRAAALARQQGALAWERRIGATSAALFGSDEGRTSPGAQTGRHTTLGEGFPCGDA